MFHKVSFGIIISSLFAITFPQVVVAKDSTNAPRDVDTTTVVEAQIQDDDLKQAAEWLDKSAQDKKTTATATTATATTTTATTAQTPDTTANTTTATTTIETAAIGSDTPIVQQAEANLKEEEIPVLSNTGTGKKIKKDAP